MSDTSFPRARGPALGVAPRAVQGARAVLGAALRWGGLRRWLCAELLVAAAVCVLYASFFNSGSWNQNARLDAIFAFVEPGPDRFSFRIDAFVPSPERGINTGDWNRVGEHYYANKLPGSILWGTLAYAPFYWALSLLELDPHAPLVTSLSAHWINFWVSVAPLAAAAWAFFRLLEARGASRLRAFWVTSALFFGTALFPYATQLWGHPTAAACVCGALYLFWARSAARGEGEASGASARRAFGAGALAGLAVCVDFMAAPFAVVCLVWAWQRSRRHALLLVLGGALGLLTILGYNTYCFGSPLRFSIEGTSSAFLDQRRWLGVFGAPSVEALWQLTFGSYRGLLLQMPVLLASLLGFGFGLHRERRDPLLWGALATVLASLWLTASFNGWHGGATVSARYLIPCLPLLALGLKALPLRLGAWPAALAVGGVSFLNMLAVAAVSPLVPDRADNPLYRVVYERFLSGALGGLRLPLRLEALSPEAGVATTINLGGLLGLEGHAQLVPVLGLSGVFLAGAAHAVGVVPALHEAYARASTKERTAAALSLVLVVVSGVYLSTLASALLGGDNAEFVLLSQRWGVAHPSGYPAYVLYLRAMSWLPGTTPAATAALATAALGVLTLVVLHRACRAWGASPLSALAACVLLAWSPRFWIASTHAEVFALNALVAALIVWLSAPGVALSAERRLWCLAAVAGFGLANHLSIVLLAPLGLVAALLALHAAERRGRAAALALGGFVLGLSPYAALPLMARAASAWSWGEVSSPAALWSHVLRQDYGTFSLGLVDQGGTPLEHIAALAAQACADLLWLPVVLLPLGAWVLLGKKERWATRALLVTLLTTGPLFVARMNLSTEGLSRAVVQRFYLLPELVLVVIAALGASRLERALGQRLRPRLGAALGIASVCAVGGAQLLATLPELGEHHAPTVQRYLENTLRSVPPGSVILGTGDQRLFGFEALQALSGLRPDVQYIDPRMLHYPWYHRRAAARFGAPLPEPRDGSLSTVALADAVLAQGRPLFVSDVFSDTLLRARPSYPWGTLIRILPGEAAPPAPAELEQANLRLFAGFDLSYALPTDATSWAFGVQSTYARPWTSLAALYGALGDERRAAINRARAAELAPGER